MPWEERSPVNERMKFVVEWSESEGENFSALCRRYGISRRIGYKWLDRFEQGGPGALEDRPPVARNVRHRVPLDVVDRLLAARKAHPTWGPRKLRAWLLDKEPGLHLPAPSTIGDVLKRYGLVRIRKRRLRVPINPNPLDPCSAPNDVWCADFKGHFALGDGSRCYPLTITDGCTRFLIKCEALTAQTEELVKRQFELAFLEYGIPKKIRTDNGPPFASLGAGGLSRLAVWWIQLGITPERIEPGKPQQNGRHERMHRTLKDQTTKPPEATMAAQQRRFDLFRAEFNNERPHESLGQKPPSRSYTTSLRAYPATLSSPVYDENLEVRRLTEQGKIAWKGQKVNISIALAGEPVGVEKLTPTTARLFYGPMLLGRLKLNAGDAVFTRSRVTGDEEEPQVDTGNSGPVSKEPDGVQTEPVSVNGPPGMVPGAANM